MKITIYTISLSTALLLATLPSQAAVIYNNLTGTNGATSGGDAGINASGGGPLGDSFSTGSSASSLIDVVLALRATNSSDGSSVTVGLYSSTTSSPPAPLAPVSVLGIVSDSSLTSSLANIDVPVTTPVSLAANTRYWIELSTTGSARWSFTNTNVGVGVANEYNYFSGTSFANSSFTPYQMEVTTSNAPEPAAIALTALGLAGLAFFRRRA